MKPIWYLTSIIAMLYPLPLRGDDTITNVLSAIVSYSYEESLATAPTLSRVFYYRYDELPNNEILQATNSASVSYYFGEATVGSASLTQSANTDATAFAFNIPTDFGTTYILEYKKSLSEAFWKVWRLIVGDGEVKSFLEEVKPNEALFIRARRTQNLLHFKFPLAGTFSTERIIGYRQGDHWLDRYCLDSGNERNRLLHLGADLGASPGDKVFAVENCAVRYARLDDTWGGYIILEFAGNHTITYTHVIPSVVAGVQVSKGEQIGTVADLNGYPDHLHFQIRQKAFSSEALELQIELRGRLPENASCVTVLTDPPDPAFPELFLDPETILWE